jgi:hypothetical protein
MKKFAVFGIVAFLMALTSTSVFADSGGPTQLNVTPGSGLTISGATPGSFAATLAGADQSAGSTLTSYAGTDTTGSASGWNVTFQATPFSCTSGIGQCPSGGDTLPAGSVLMAPPTVACNEGTSCSGRASAPSISISANAPLDSGSAVMVASAAPLSGMGSYTFTPVNIAGTTKPLSLAVPSYAYASTYNSTLTVSVVSGP